MSPLAVRAGGAAAFLVLPLLAAVSACESVLDPDSERVLGTLSYTDEGEPEISAPDTVDAGEPFTVTVVTWWPNGCASLDDTEVRATAAEVHVIPWDRVTEEDDESLCPQAVERMIHSVTLSRATPAELVLNVHGRRLQGGERVDVRITRELVVREP